MRSRKEAITALCDVIEKWASVISAVDTDDLYRYLTAPSGWTLGVYADGSVHVGDSVGREIDPSEQPVAMVRCRGIGQLDMTYWRAGWECDHLDDCAVVKDCCENGSVEAELDDLRAKLIDSLGS